MGDIAVTAQILDPSATLVLDVSTGGYEVVALSVSDRIWRTVEVKSPFVDGDHTSSAVLDSQTFELIVRVRGATWVQVEQRFAALLAAISAFSWLFAETTQGVTSIWRVSRPADSMSKRTKVGVANRFRLVTIPIRVQPTPAVTGL